MITISNIRIEDEEDRTKLCANVDYKNKITTIWYEVDKKNKKYLCFERADAFLDALLLFAMQHEEDIQIINTPVSSKLYFNISRYIIPAYAKLNGRYKNIKLICETTSEKLDNYNFNGCGISRGVDSFYTLKESAEYSPEELKINCLTFFNVGSQKSFGGEEARKLFNKRKAISKKFSEENGFSFIDVDSNISEFLQQVFVETHTFRSTSAVFAIQKAFKNYYYSSGYSLYEFKFVEDAPAKSDIFLLSMLSNDNVNFYSSGFLNNRLEKTQEIADYLLAQKNLNVCFNDEINCGKCEKCIRTIFEFYINDYLDNFKEVFNIDEFYKNKDWYEYNFMARYYEGKQDYIDAYKVMKTKNKTIKLKNKIKGYLFYKARVILPKEIKDKIKDKIKEGRRENA